MLAGLTALSGPAAADADESALPEDSVVVSPGTEPRPGMKSGATAFWWSLLGTAVPVGTASIGLYRNDQSSNVTGAVLVGGLIIGPSLGHFYASRPAPGLIGIGIRTLATAAVGAGVGAALDDSNMSDFAVLGVTGAIVGTASVIWDIASAPHSARVHNERAQRGHTTLGITPSMGSAGLGLRAAVSF